MSADCVLWFRRPNGVVFSLPCHEDLREGYLSHYKGKGFEALPGEPAAVVVKGDLAPEPEPKAEPEPVAEDRPRRRRQ